MSSLDQARRVLVVDDTPAIHQDFRKILEVSAPASDFGAAKAALFGDTAAPTTDRRRPEFRVDSALQGEEAARKVAASLEAGDPYLLAFVDMRMPPGWDGVRTIEELWKIDKRIQIVICTAHSDHSMDEIADRLGISDKLLFLRKPVDPAEILQIATTLGEKWTAERSAEFRVEALATAVQERTAEIEHAMLHDRLTGLANRMLIQTRLDSCIQRRMRNPDHHFALIYLDFDRFKMINDSLGHEVGDRLLVAISERLRSALRTADGVARLNTASRIGGDEFLVLLEDLREEKDAGLVAERLLKTLAQPYEVGEHTLQITASLGVATSAQRYDAASDMVRDADTAMYRAKAAGRDRYMMFDAHMHEQVVKRMSMEQALRAAIQAAALDVHFQPIVCMQKGQVCGYEALLRWTHPELGAVPAGELVALAEETGLIHPLSLLVLRTACRQLRALQQEFGDARHFMMSVNLSRRQLLDQELVTKIASVICEAQIEPGMLVLEITESTALTDSGTAERALKQLCEMGVWLHLDDFGTGYSSLSCLYRLPITGLKIDREFIRGVFERPEHEVVLESIVRIAKAFKLKIIAEGVETTEQFALLRSLGIDHAQGFLFGKAVSGTDTAQLLSRPIPGIEACLAAFP